MNSLRECISLFFAMLLLAVAAGCSYRPPIPKEMLAQFEATDCSREQCIDFIYLHGSARPYKEQKEEFYAYTDVMHKYAMAELYSRSEIHEGLLENDRFKINPEPVKFYWGDMSSEEFEMVEKLLQWSEEKKGEPGTVARMVLGAAVLGMHDTFWIAQQQNKRKVHLALHKIVMDSLTKGRQVVLFGHSAGAMAIQGYGLFHSPYINLAEHADIQPEGEVKDLFASLTENTCVRALLEANLFEFLQDGPLTLRLARDKTSDMEAFQSFRSYYWNDRARALPDFTREYCLPVGGGVRGLITYGNPGPVLEGTITGEERDLFFLALRNIIQDNFFWINIRHINDPVGYDMYDEADLPEILAEFLEMDVARGGGFFISGTATKGATVLTAHSWYWLKPEQFARVLADTYVQGFKNRFVVPEADPQQ
jgi:hypothetical protein